MRSMLPGEGTSLRTPAQDPPMVAAGSLASRVAPPSIPLSDAAPVQASTQDPPMVAAASRVAPWAGQPAPRREAASLQASAQDPPMVAAGGLASQVAPPSIPPSEGTSRQAPLQDVPMVATGRLGSPAAPPSIPPTQAASLQASAQDAPSRATASRVAPQTPPRPIPPDKAASLPEPAQDLPTGTTAGRVAARAARMTPHTEFSPVPIPAQADLPADNVRKVSEDVAARPAETGPQTQSFAAALLWPVITEEPPAASPDAPTITAGPMGHAPRERAIPVAPAPAQSEFSQPAPPLSDFGSRPLPKFFRAVASAGTQQSQPVPRPEPLSIFAAKPAAAPPPRQAFYAAQKREKPAASIPSVGLPQHQIHIDLPTQPKLPAGPSTAKSPELKSLPTTAPKPGVIGRPDVAEPEREPEAPLVFRATLQPAEDSPADQQAAPDDSSTPLPTANAKVLDPFPAIRTDIEAPAPAEQPMPAGSAHPAPPVAHQPAGSDTKPADSEDRVTKSAEESGRAPVGANSFAQHPAAQISEEPAVAATAIPRPFAPQDPRPAAAPRSVQRTIEPPQTVTTRDIKLQVGGPGEARVEVRLSERAGDVLVSVRSADSRLAGDLRGNLPALASRLEQSGYHATGWQPFVQPDHGHAAETTAGTASQDANGQSGHNGRSREDNPRHQHPKEPENPEEHAGPTERGKDFAWLLTSIR